MLYRVTEKRKPTAQSSNAYVQRSVPENKEYTTINFPSPIEMNHLTLHYPHTYGA